MTIAGRPRSKGIPAWSSMARSRRRCWSTSRASSNPGREMTGCATQARAPLFELSPFELRGRGPTADGKAAELWAVTPEGTVAMSARATFS